MHINVEMNASVNGNGSMNMTMNVNTNVNKVRNKKVTINLNINEWDVEQSLEVVAACMTTQHDCAACNRTTQLQRAIAFYTCTA